MVLNARSPSLQYQIKVLEDELRGGNDRPSDAKTRTATSILEQIIPLTGVYKDVLSLVLATLKRAIYSTTLTSTEAHSQAYLPYFEMVFRLEEEKRAEAEELKDESEQLRCEVTKTKSESETIAAQLDKKTARIELLQEEMGELQRQIADRDLQAGCLEGRISSLEDQLASAADLAASREQAFEAELKQREEEVSSLATYKEHFYRMQKEFFSDSNEQRLLNGEERGEERDEEGEEGGRVLQGQLVGIVNTLLDEQDNFTDRYNSVVLGSKGGADSLTGWNKRYIVMRESFAEMGAKVLNELKLLTTHISQEERARRGRIGAEEAEVEEDDDDDEEQVDVSNLFAEGADPFNSRELITAKYSAAVEISTNGCITFSNLPGSWECPSCDATVFVCPHTHFDQHSVIQLPGGATHLRVTRPLLSPPPTDCLAEARKQMHRLEMEAENGADEQREEAEEEAGKRPASQRAISRNDQISVRDINRKLLGMWRDAHRERWHVSRDLSEEYVSTTIHHFHLYLSNLMKDDLYQSSLDHFGDFLLAKYQLEDLMGVVKIDILRAISNLAMENPLVAIFGAILAGNIDPIVLRYVYLLNEILLQLDLVCTLDLRPLFIVLYRHLTDEDIDPHVLSYSSFANNRISAALVSRYLMACIVRDREPRMVECAGRLRQTTGGDPNSMDRIEFGAVMETVYPLATNKSKDHYFRCSAVNCVGGGRVRTVLLGQVVAFLLLKDSYPRIVSEINDKIHHHRHKIPTEMVEAGIRAKQGIETEPLPSLEQSRRQLSAINKASKGLELLHGNPCWRQDVDIAPEYLELTKPAVTAAV